MPGWGWFIIVPVVLGIAFLVAVILTYEGPQGKC